MKKTITIFISILIGLFIFLSLLSARGDYAVEKIIWHTNQRLDKAARSPEAVPDKVYEEIIASYRKVVDDFPTSKLAPGAYLLIGETYTVKKSYDEARQVLAGICPMYPKNAILCTQAAISLAKTHELEDNWPQALKVYEKIIDGYPLTDGGLMTPLYIAKYYEKNEKPRRAQGAYNKAINHYNELIAKNENPMIEFKVLGALSRAYIATQRWRDALDALSKSLSKYPNTRTAGPILHSINIIALAKLQDKDLAINLYQEIIDKKPGHPLAKHLNKIIKGIQTLKESDINIMLKEK